MKKATLFAFDLEGILFVIADNSQTMKGTIADLGCDLTPIESWLVKEYGFDYCEYKGIFNSEDELLRLLIHVIPQEYSESSRFSVIIHSNDGNEIFGKLLDDWDVIYRNALKIASDKLNKI